MIPVGLVLKLKLGPASGLKLKGSEGTGNCIWLTPAPLKLKCLLLGCPSRKFDEAGADVFMAPPVAPNWNAFEEAGKKEAFALVWLGGVTCWPGAVKKERVDEGGVLCAWLPKENWAKEGVVCEEGVPNARFCWFCWFCGGCCILEAPDAPNRFNTGWLWDVCNREPNGAILGGAGDVLAPKSDGCPLVGAAVDVIPANKLEAAGLAAPVGVRVVVFVDGVAPKKKGLTFVCWDSVVSVAGVFALEKREGLVVVDGVDVAAAVVVVVAESVAGLRDVVEKNCDVWPAPNVSGCVVCGVVWVVCAGANENLDVSPRLFFLAWIRVYELIDALDLE